MLSGDSRTKDDAVTYKEKQPRTENDRGQRQVDDDEDQYDCRAAALRDIEN